MELGRHVVHEHPDGGAARVASPGGRGGAGAGARVVGAAVLVKEGVVFGAAGVGGRIHGHGDGRREVSGCGAVGGDGEAGVGGAPARACGSEEEDGGGDEDGGRGERQ
uniref:Uncharacterized protein n=1 Tax=Arundo donax TaxID=35708 RepID=A0A0A9FI11_ARUDO